MTNCSVGYTHTHTPGNDVKWGWGGGREGERERERAKKERGGEKPKMLAWPDERGGREGITSIPPSPDWDVFFSPSLFFRFPSQIFVLKPSSSSSSSSPLFSGLRLGDGFEWLAPFFSPSFFLILLLLLRQALIEMGDTRLIWTLLVRQASKQASKQAWLVFFFWPDHFQIFSRQTWRLLGWTCCNHLWICDECWISQHAINLGTQKNLLLLLHNLPGWLETNFTFQPFLWGITMPFFRVISCFFLWPFPLKAW